ncbi:MAG: phosphoenolpyruvate synthase [Bacteroidetes bacterium]|nr:phosphoenolpyruvate synthase [Bacteroidota bacterium]
MSFTLAFHNIDKTSLPTVGGKAANLGQLTKIKDLQIPPGFCITTEAFKTILDQNPKINNLLDQLSLLKPTDLDKIKILSANIRKAIEATPIPQNITEELIPCLDNTTPYAIRSSATAEDLPSASFAGQQDTYLNIIGTPSILTHISKCWASLFTERAITYRLQNNFDHNKVHLAVIVQKMIFPQTAGILFTADPITSNRNITSIDASFGLGEALVSGLVNPDIYKVKNDQITERNISAKKLAILPSKNGGTTPQPIAPQHQSTPALTDPQILQLAQIGRTIEQHFGSPQDIEWCLADHTFYILQSRPITTLFPIPEAPDQSQASDPPPHVYVSVGHQQMMTDALKPLGLSVWQLSAARPMFTAGGRLFVDIAPQLATAAGREMIINVLGKNDPLIKDALTTLLEREDFTQPTETQPSHTLPNFQTLNDYPPSIVDDLIEQSQTAIQELKQTIQTKSGAHLIDFIIEHEKTARQAPFNTQGFGVIMTAMNAASWLNEKIQEWLGEVNVADTLTQSVPHNITSEMGLALLDVADIIRPYPEVIEYLQQTKDENFITHLSSIHGGPQAQQAIQTYLDKYGMRCAGEIDITRTRWSEKPLTLLPTLLGNIKNLPQNAGRNKFEQGKNEAQKKEKEILHRLNHLPDGNTKSRETKRMIDLVRNFSGYREYPKYAIVSRYFIYKQALLKETQFFPDKEDIYYLTLEELREAIRTKTPPATLITQRKEQHKRYEKLTPPRVITSEGEILTGKYKRENLPKNAIIGLAVSSGTIEGRARIILNMEDADLEEGDILVTPFTDPSWTPLFVSIKGLITEVGGLMTHGAVIAREYGLPAVVGVENATTLIKDGWHIRLNGTEGYIEIL